MAAVTDFSQMSRVTEWPLREEQIRLSRTHTWSNYDDLQLQEVKSTGNFMPGCAHLPPLVRISNMEYFASVESQLASRPQKGSGQFSSRMNWTIFLDLELLLQFVRYVSVGKQ